jgi:O-antigen/teichoic acid export membrane protein
VFSGQKDVLRRAARRLGWGVADQAVSSLSNAAMSFYIARELGAAQFGAFSLAYVTYSFALNASRGLATDPLLVRFSGTDLVTWRRAITSSTGTAALMGFVTGTCALMAAAVLAGAPRLAFLALGLTLPGLLLQDSWRYSFFALGRGSQALLNDTVWTVALLPAMLMLRITHQQSVFWFVLAWGATAAFAACVGPLQARVIPRPARALDWVSQHRDLGPRYLAENTANSGASQLRIYCVGGIAGLASVGYVQAAGLLMGPFLVIFMGISLVTVPEAARVLRQSPRHLQLYCVLVGGGLALLAAVWGGVLLVLLPKGLGNLLLGKELWRPASRLVLPFTISVMGGCVIDGAAAGLHALGAARRSLRAMIVASVLFLVCGVAGAYYGGAMGTVRGAALATCTGALVWWWHLRMAMREAGHLPARGETPSGEPESESAHGGRQEPRHARPSQAA